MFDYRHYKSPDIYTGEFDPHPTDAVNLVHAECPVCAECEAAFVDDTGYGKCLNTGQMITEFSECSFNNQSRTHGLGF